MMILDYLNILLLESVLDLLVILSYPPCCKKDVSSLIRGKEMEKIT